MHGVGDEQPFDLSRHDLLAVREDQQFLLAAGDRQESVRVERAEVAGVEPAVANRFGRRLGLLPVTLHDVRAAREDLAVGRDLHLDAGQRRADRVRLCFAKSG